MAGHHDIGYKLLFAHPELVRELLAEFTDFNWLGAVDVGAFERVNPGYVSDRFSERQDDIVFRLELSEAPGILVDVVSSLSCWLAQDTQAPLQRSVQTWVEQLVARQFNSTELLDALHSVEGRAMELVKKYETWADMFEDRGLQRGLAQGREQAMRSALLKILEKRFGGVPVTALLTLEQASLEQLEQWLDQALDAPSAEALLGAPAAAH